MEALNWTVIGLLAATLFGNTWYLGSKIDSKFDALSGRIDALSARIDALADRLDARIDALAGQLAAHIDRHAS